MQSGDWLQSWGMCLLPWEPFPYNLLCILFCIEHAVRALWHIKGEMTAFCSWEVAHTQTGPDRAHAHIHIKACVHKDTHVLTYMCAKSAVMHTHTPSLSSHFFVLPCSLFLCTHPSYFPSFACLNTKVQSSPANSKKGGPEANLWGGWAVKYCIKQLWQTSQIWVLVVVAGEHLTLKIPHGVINHQRKSSFISGHTEYLMLHLVKTHLHFCSDLPLTMWDYRDGEKQERGIWRPLLCKLRKSQMGGKKEA